MKALAKKLLKKTLDLLCLALVAPLFILQILLGSISDGDATFWSISQLLSLFPGKLGSFLRKNYYFLAMKQCSNDCSILFGTLFSHTDTEIGKGVYIGPQCNIGKCRIEDDCTIGSGVHILSGKRQHKFDNIDRPIREQGGEFVKLKIGEDTWIGNCAIILANVGKKCVVGAGSVVTRDVDDFSIVAGNPAKIIGKRE